MILKKILDKKNIISGIVLVAAVILLIIFPKLSWDINHSIQSAYSTLHGESEPDTNIVIIDISENDINSLGHWPIKRSYYALLIKSLSGYGVKTIGLEVFLSAKYVTQTLYDNLLTREIEKAGNVVLSSVAGNIIFRNGKYYTDSLSFPSPKLLNEKLQTGHLNYLTKNGIKIPLIIYDNGIKEDAFSLQMFGGNTGNYGSKELTVNFVAQWRRFTHISLIHYFGMVSTRNPFLEKLKDKYVIIGITDPLIASSMQTTFDNNLPGVALHAFALDNLLKNRGIVDDLILPSVFVFIFLICALYFMHLKIIIKKYFLFFNVVLIVFLFITYIFFAYFYIPFSYSFFLIPYIAFGISELSFFILGRNILLEGAIDESKILKSLLAKKELDLERLQKELETGSKDSNSLVEKIRLLKEDIFKLRENDEDTKAAEIESDTRVREFQGLVYRSKNMQQITEIVSKVAPGDANVLILGESGTGKELVARAIHSLSPRNNNNFIAVNCGAISDSLLESELFGHVKGAFTGAITDKIGRFEAADNGTIFLDEIAETSENFQVKLLRVIQHGDFEKVGSSKSQHVNVRIIAATNKRLDKEVREKRFREDLYYRLNVIKIELPPLRERKEDIEILAGYFLNLESPGLKLSKAAVEALEKYDWKGNVRELEAVIKRAVIFAKSSGREMIQLADLNDEIVRESKFDFEDLVIESLRNKKFSRSSIIETTKELGNVSRTVISENFRGYSLKCYVENNFNSDKAVRIIAASDEKEVLEKVNIKLNLFLKNIETDLEDLKSKDFEEIKSLLNSKYKNLPHKFHFYLDAIIKQKI